MIISKYSDYLVINRKQKNSSAWVTKVCDGGLLLATMNENTYAVEKISTYEIYTRHPDTGENGWDISHVESTDDLIKFYPYYDCIITKNDSAGVDCVEFTHSGWLEYLSR